MSTVKIDGGVIQVGVNQYRYDYTKVDGFHSITFTAARRPQIGDTVDDVTNVWTPAVLPQSNQDKHMWINEGSQEWPDFS